MSAEQANAVEAALIGTDGFVLPGDKVRFNLDLLKDIMNDDNRTHVLVIAHIERLEDEVRIWLRKA